VDESSPEKAGVGGSIPSLATIDSILYSPPDSQFHYNSFQYQLVHLDLPQGGSARLEFVSSPISSVRAVFSVSYSPFAVVSPCRGPQAGVPFESRCLGVNR
jgi:hypothetical protein